MTLMATPRFTRLSSVRFRVFGLAGDGERKRCGVAAESRAMNQAIRAAIPKFSEERLHRYDQYEWLFVCECGCLTWVARTLAAFDLEGAFAVRHAPRRSELQGRMPASLK